MKRAELEQLTVRELRLLAAQLGVPKCSRMVKSELVATLASVKTPAAPTKAPKAGKAKKTTQSSTRTRRKVSHTTGKRAPIPASLLNQSSSSSLRVSAPPSPVVTGADPGLPIPEHYGQDRLVLMVQDPHHLFAYWELQGETVARATNTSRGGTPVLVLYMGDHRETREVDLRGGNYYLAVTPDQDYIAELAMRDNSGTLHVLVRSNAVRTPTPSISTRVDERWMGVDETFHELLELAGLPGQVAGAGSNDRLRNQRLLAWSWDNSSVTGLSSTSLSSSSRSSTARLAK